MQRHRGHDISDDAFNSIFNVVIKGIGWIIIGVFAGVVQLVRALIPERVENLVLPLQTRFEHMHVVAGSGHGKTQTLQHIIVTEDLPAVARRERSLLVIDSQGMLLRNILSLAELAPSRRQLSERLIYIDPNDLETPPCLNLFDFGLDRLASYTPLEREKLVAGAVSLYGYLFGSLLGAELTNKQGASFGYLARLLMVVPHPTIYTLMDFMEEPERVAQYLPALDPLSRRFFEKKFFSPGYDGTRQQILDRLWGVLSNSNVLARMFSHQDNRLNLFRAMNRGSLILINTAKDLLKQEGCEIFGRFMIALLAQAVQERSALPEHKLKPTFIYIDEAHDYFGAGMESLINQGRKYKAGVIMAHQNLGQFDRALRQNVMASSAIKMAGGVSADDAGALAREMRVTPEFLMGLKKDHAYTRFALSIKNRVPQVTVQPIPLGTLERQPKMSERELEQLLAENRERYCAPVDMTVFTGPTGPPFPLGPPGAV